MLYPWFKRMLKQTLIIATVVLLLAGCASNQAQNHKRHSKQQAARYNVVLGLNQMKKNESAKAKNRLWKAKKLAPKDPLVLDAVAYYFERNGDKQKAENYYQKALKKAPKSPEAANNYGTFLCRQDQVDKALTYFEKAANAPQYAHTVQTYENAGRCAQKAGQHKKAIAYYRQLLAMQPHNSQALEHLVQINHEQGHDRQAKKYLKRLNQVAPGSKQVKHWQQKLSDSNSENSHA